MARVPLTADSECPDCGGSGVEYAAREGEGLCPACVEAVCGRLSIRCQKQPQRDVEET